LILNTPFLAAFSAAFAMLSFFNRVDLAKHRADQLAIAERLKEHPPPRAATPPPKRAVGRPKLVRSAAELLAAGAAADALDLRVPDNKRRKYTRWFNSPWINDIMHAHAKSGGSARDTVKLLQANAPDDRYEHLAHSTVASWFDTQGNLHEKRRIELEAGRALATASGPSPALQSAPGAEEAICDILLKLRQAGTPLNTFIIRWVMQAVLQERCPALLQQLMLSRSFISRWVRKNPRLQFRWRSRTTAASKLPDDWEEQGIRMAQRIGATMQLHKVRIMSLAIVTSLTVLTLAHVCCLTQVHPSLAINMDQTGVNLVSASSFTYEMVGSSDVAVVGAEDKRQITACVAASLRGDLLPLQLIFQGKTARSLPPATAASIAARVDITHSDNHWSTQQTMQGWITRVLLPHTERMIQLYELDADAHVLLLLDSWSVHRSAEFRAWLQREHPRIHLVYVPSNCTSKLQLADVALQRPFKSSITQSFCEWAAAAVAEQIRAGQVTGIAEQLGMKALKPLVLQWCIDSWSGLRERKQLILDGWEQSCCKLYNINSEQRRRDAVELVALKKLELDVQPDGSEPDGYFEDEDDEDAELDVSQPRAFGKQGERVRTQAKSFGYMVDPTRIEFNQESLATAATDASH
jgi:hypothetical protein